ncbi:MAG: M48 family metallopeptidase [Nitrospirae bacterium]|nr:M48 family metallopeptidase [Nitrospirota bacterium]
MYGYLMIIFIAYLFVAGFRYWLDYLNLSCLRQHGTIPPPEFEGQIDQGLLSKIRDYTIEKIWFGFISSVFNNIILLLFLFGGLLNIYNLWIASKNLSFILSGLFFFLPLLYAESTLSIPFDLYNIFKIEKKYGFSNMTFRLWVMDTIKSLFISTILLSLVISIGLYLVQKSPDFWWFWVWCFFFAFTIFMMYISPYVIEPLFHRFRPIQDEALVGSIRALMQKVGITVSRVFMMDASKRTRHTNAYFTGIGKVKRIVLYDTLIEKMDHDELLSVLAHEAGHWKRKHLLKFILLTEGIAFIGMYISFRLLQADLLLNLFNIKDGTFFAKVVILGFLGSIVAVPFSPLLMSLSRRHENEADRFSYELTGNAQGMISALVKLSRDNLSNLSPHPLYVIFHYSHPPVLERIREIKSW